MNCTFMSVCTAPVSIRLEWGLLKVNGQPRKKPFNKAEMCSECYRKIKQMCFKAVEEGRMHWSVSVVKPETASK